jgi:hypothetical protein
MRVWMSCSDYGQMLLSIIRRSRVVLSMQISGTNLAEPQKRTNLNIAFLYRNFATC